MDNKFILKQLYNRYIEPTKHKKDDFIGIEIEMPIVNLNKEAVDFDVVHKLTAAFLERFGFAATGYDDDGNIYSAQSTENGDILSYDCSYNNLELSFGRERNISVIHARFKEYYGFIQSFFSKYNYTLTGMGVNPYRKYNKNIPIENGRYRMLFHHLGTYKRYNLPMYFHEYPDFGTFSSASQVQLDVDYENLPLTINTFTKLEPIKALLFNNSVLLGEHDELHCCRDMFWENSTHGINPHNIGMFECEIGSADDLLSYIASTSIYCVERGDKYINFAPTNIVEYMNSESIEGEYYENGEYKPIEVKPEIGDLEYLRTFKFEDLTFRGTVEFRSVCCQPISDCMSVAAFHTGLMNRLDELSQILGNDTVLYHSGYNASELRRMFVKSELPEFVDEDKLYKLAQDILNLSIDGLKERGLGEEKFLEPLQKRIETRTNPAGKLYSLLRSGASLEDIIIEYAKL